MGFITDDNLAAVEIEGSGAVREALGELGRHLSKAAEQANAVPDRKVLRRLVGEVLAGAPGHDSGVLWHEVFGTCDLGAQRGLQNVFREAEAGIRHNVRLPDAEADRFRARLDAAGSDAEGIRKVLLAREQAVMELWCKAREHLADRLADHVVEHFKAAAARRAKRTKELEGAPARMVKLSKIIVPAAAKLRRDLETLADLMQRTGDGVGAADLRNSFARPLEKLDRVVRK